MNYLTTEDAAVRLATTPRSLQARCRRIARREGREIRAYLGDGVVAVKMGRRWRVRFPEVPT